MIISGKGNMNSAFYTVVNLCCDTDTSNKLIQAYERYEKEHCCDYWRNFGYKYFGLIGTKKIDQINSAINESEIENKYYAKSIVEIYYGEQLEQNSSIVSAIGTGIADFLNNDISKIVSEELSLVGIRYLADNASIYDVKNIYGAFKKVDIDGGEYFLPVTPRERYSFGVVYPWPGIDTAETELLARIGRAAKNINFDYYMLSDYGFKLDEEQLETKELIDGADLDYIMTTHYESCKTVDTYYYHLLWNPPDIPLNTDYYDGRVIDNYIMNDDYLIYDFGGMSNHLRSMLIDKPRTLEGASTFVGSFPKSVAMEPNLDDPKLFYCGMNWEKAIGDKNRHEGLFKLLDDTGKVKFYGPDKVEAWGGLRPWEGYKNYQYPVPFDGFSILKEINSCGICLAISSDSHRRAGAVTNRAYEACAAGAVIISDNNIFMEEYFGDSVLYVTYNKKNPKDTFDQIMEKYQWIVDHKDEAIAMAKKSQQIFIEKFCMEKGLIDVTHNHYARFKTIESDLFAKDDTKTVLICNVLNTKKTDEIADKLENIVKNVEHQYYRNIVLGIACDDSLADEVRNYANKVRVNIEVVSAELFDEKDSRCMTDAQATRLIQEKVEHDYVMFIGESETWFYDHVTTLVRSLEDNPDSYVAYSGVLVKDLENRRRAHMFSTMEFNNVFNNTLLPGQLIFVKGCEKYVPYYMLGCLDGYEYEAMIALTWVKYKKDISFSKRMTMSWDYTIHNDNSSVIDLNRQVRFIRGLIKYDHTRNELDMSYFAQEEREVLLKMPIKKFLSVRLWKKLDFLFGRRPVIGKSINSKYYKKLDEFYRAMARMKEY